MIATWVLVAVGLVFNIIAALTTHFVIEERLLEVHQLQQTQQANNMQIGLKWQSITLLEQKRDALMLLLSQPTELPDPIKTSLLRQLSDLLQHPIEEISSRSFADIDKLVLTQQQLSRSAIDTTYLQNLALMEQENTLSNQVNSLKSMAIFLQVIGLALILARDLKRKP